MERGSNKQCVCLNINSKGGVLMWKVAPVGGLSARMSIVDNGGVLMWKEAPVNTPPLSTIDV